MNKNNLPKPSLKVQSFITWFLLLSLAFLFLTLSKTQTNEISFSEFMRAVKANQIETVSFQGQKILGKYRSSEIEGKTVEGKTFESVGATNSDVYLKILEENKVTPNYVPESSSNFLFTLMLLSPILVLVWLTIKKNPASSLTNFGKVNKMIDPKDLKVKFEDIAGIDEIKKEVSEIVDFLKSPDKYKAMGAKIPKGVLLWGNPGTGKTMLAKAMANEAQVPFFSLSGSDFVEMFVGVGASRVRSLFESAKKSAPCIIFIDEIDAVGKKRSDHGGMGSNTEQENTLNQLLTEMDGFQENSGIIIIGATNRLDSLDQALLRPGRFDRKVKIDLPDMKGREQILKIHARNKKMSPDINFTILSQATTGMAGADLENLLNEAALTATRNKKESIDMDTIEEARDKILMGVERKTLVMKDSEKRKTAIHESGHALITLLLPNLDRLHKVSIIPRGMALGVTQTTPEENQVSFDNRKAESYIKMLMAGRAAEEVEFNHFSSGASDDLKRATMIARKMVCEWGMSPRVGPVSFNQSQNGLENNLISSETMKMIDAEISLILNKNYDDTKKLLLLNKGSLHKMTDLLMKKETCSGEELLTLIEADLIKPN